MQFTLREEISKSPIPWAGLLDAIPEDFIYIFFLNTNAHLLSSHSIRKFGTGCAKLTAAWGWPLLPGECSRTCLASVAPGLWRPPPLLLGRIRYAVLSGTALPAKL